jgi:hypothetical protein
MDKTYYSTLHLDIHCKSKQRNSAFIAVLHFSHSSVLFIYKWVSPAFNRDILNGRHYSLTIIRTTPLSNFIILNFEMMTTKTDWNIGHCFGQTQNCGGVRSMKGIATLLWSNLFRYTNLAIFKIVSSIRQALWKLD